MVGPSHEERTARDHRESEFHTVLIHRIQQLDDANIRLIRLVKADAQQAIQARVFTYTPHII